MVLLIFGLLLPLIYIAKRLYFHLKEVKGTLRGRNLGPWAVVTGATDGIGAEYARQLASFGINTVLISRSSEKLGSFAIELNSSYNVQVRTVSIDFTSGMEIYPKIQMALEGLDIGTLINNVGMTQPKPSYMHQISEDSLTALFNCNMLSTTMMTKLLLPSMVERGCGFIVNVGSMAAEVSFPFLSIYAATKAYVDKLSQDLNLEYRDKGVFVQSLIPACVATKMSHIERPFFLAPAPKDFVASALAEVGEKGRSPGYIGHKIQLYWFRFLRICFSGLFEKYNFTVMNNWRRAALKNK